MEWEYSEDYGYWVCPNCDFGLEDFDDPTYSPDDCDYNYCPCCGQKLTSSLFVIVTPGDDD